MTNATKRTLARLGSVLSRAPISTPVGLVVAAGCLAAETAVTLWLKALAPGDAFGVLYLIGVLIVSTGWGLGLAAATAMVSALAYDYLRKWPDVSGVLNRVEDWVVVVVFVAVALVAQILARFARTRAADAEARRREAEASREELSVLAEQQAALRRIATLVARGVPASEVFPAVTQELARSLGVANAALWRYESDRSATLGMLRFANHFAFRKAHCSLSGP